MCHYRTQVLNAPSTFFSSSRYIEPLDSLWNACVVSQYIRVGTYNITKTPNTCNVMCSASKGGRKTNNFIIFHEIAVCMMGKENSNYCIRWNEEKNEWKQQKSGKSPRKAMMTKNKRRGERVVADDVKQVEPRAPNLTYNTTVIPRRVYADMRASKFG